MSAKRKLPSLETTGYTGGHTLLNDLEARILERDERNGISRVEINFSTDARRILEGVKYAVLGSSSIWVPKGRNKYLDSSVFPISAGEIAREYLRFIGASRSAITKMPKPRVDPPLFYDPSRTIDGEWEYVDLTSCYWQIYHASTFDFRSGTGIFGSYRSRGQVEFSRCEEWRQFKVERNAVWGSIISRSVRAWNGETIKTLEYGGEFYSPGLAQWMMDVLHSIAYDVVNRSGSPLFFTDGFLTPYGSGDHWINYLRETWGMQATVKETGSGKISGPGNYEWRKSFDPQSRSKFQSNISPPSVLPDEWKKIASSHSH